QRHSEKLRRYPGEFHPSDLPPGPICSLCRLADRSQWKLQTTEAKQQNDSNVGSQNLDRKFPHEQFASTACQRASAHRAKVSKHMTLTGPLLPGATSFGIFYLRESGRTALLTRTVRREAVERLCLRATSRMGNWRSEASLR